MPPRLEQPRGDEALRGRSAQHRRRPLDRINDDCCLIHDFSLTATEICEESFLPRCSPVAVDEVWFDRIVVFWEYDRTRLRLRLTKRETATNRDYFFYFHRPVTLPHSQSSSLPPLRISILEVPPSLLATLSSSLSNNITPKSS